jgi:hypothetical protein
LNWLSSRFLGGRTDLPRHLPCGKSEEKEDAYFELRKLVSMMVARNFCSPLRRGEIDWIGGK